MNRTRKLSVVLAFLLFLQIGLPGWSAPKSVEAASTGPVAMSFYPADNLSNVPLGANLRIVFDENVKRGSHTTSFTIYRSSDNYPIETILADSSKITFPNQREAVIDPAAGLVADTEYYVLIDDGFFLNASNNAPYSGIQSATKWNFRTTTATTPDTTKPGLIPLNPFTYEQNSSTSIIKVNFNETVYASRGYIKLVSTNDIRNLPVTSSSVTGSGSTQITITPEGALVPGTTYTLTIESNSFEDASGNTLNEASWSFNTDPAVVYTTSFYPADNAQLVPLYDTTGASNNLDLVINFNVAVQANANKRIEIRQVSDNKAVLSIAANSMSININSTEVTIDTAGRLSATTSYYVWIEPGAFSSASDINDLYYGISGATIWNFRTGYGASPGVPTIQTYSPARNGTMTGTNSKLILTFNEPVTPDSGNIYIYQASDHTLFRKISVMSERVTGGGTNQLVIDATSAFTNDGALKYFSNNTKYYVTIDSYAIRNGADRYMPAITGTTGWAFTVTQDVIRPTLNTLTPSDGATTVAIDAKFYASFNEPIDVDTNKTISFIPTTASRSTYQANFYVDPTDNKRVIIEPSSPSTSLEANTNYYINIDEGAIVDLVGNSFIGIKNTSQWTFLTQGGDRTAPTISKSEVNGSVIRLIYSEPMDATLTPTPASYYVTVAGAPRNVTSVKVEGNMVLLTLSSSVGYSQKVEVSYTKPSDNDLVRVKDISGNHAASLSKLEVTNGFTSSTPVVTGGSVYGNTITLNFSDSLMTPSSYAYTQFTVSAGGINYSPTSIWHSGNVVQLTLSSSIPNGQPVIVTYSPGSYLLNGMSGNAVSAFTNSSLTSGGGNTNDTIAPVLQSISSSGTMVTIKYNEMLKSNISPSVYQYSVLAGGQLQVVSNAVVAGDSVYLTLGNTTPTGQNVSVTYVGGSMVQDLSGNPAAAFTNVTAGTGTSSGTGGTATLQGAILKGSRLTLNFSAALDATSVPSTGNFLLRVNDTASNIRTVQITGSSVILTLSSPATVGARAEITYFGYSNGLKVQGGQAITAFSNVNVANQTTMLDSLTGDFEPSEEGNGIVIRSGATTSTDRSPAGVSASRYTINQEKFLTAVSTSRSAGLTSHRIEFKVPDSERAAIVAVPVATLESADALGGDVTFIVRHGNVSYELPLEELNFSDLSTEFGGNAFSNQVVVAIDQGYSTLTSPLRNALSSSKASVIAEPVYYEVAVVNGLNKLELNDFDGYVTRSIKTTAAVDESQSSVVWLDPVTGTISYVPTNFTTELGVTKATFHRKGNSAYALVRNTSSFSDMGSHWAAGTVQMMARKFIVEGHTATKFEPDKSITRGEFATYIAKGLGLTGDRTAAAKFKDVNANTVMGAYIGAAAAAGIVNGVDSSNFKPNSYITRQDMATMMMRAWSAAGKTISLPSSTDSYLSKFTDRSKVGSYAKTNMAQAIYLGIINGKTATTLSPTTNATRAEGSVMIMRLLEKAEFLTQ